MPTEEHLRLARALILEHGWNATAYQILNPGIELWFSASGDAVVGYVRHRRTMVVGGAPVCALDRLDQIATEFAAAARDRGLRICYFGAGDRLESIYADDPGWSRVLLGAQPIWDPRQWSAAVASRPSLRAQFNRARNKGIAIREWDVRQAENNQALRRCLGEWLATRGLPPLHFMVEPETLSSLRDRRVFVAEREGRQVVAFTVLSPVPARNGWLVEQIVRGRSAPNGTSESLIDFAMRAVGASGAAYATLGLSPLSQRARMEQPPQPMWLRLLLEWVRLHGARFYNFVGLDSFKAKFNPQEWEPIYAIAQGRRFSPTALYAIAGAFSGGAPARLVFGALARAAGKELATLARKLTSKVNRVRRGH
ncbi:MAG: phosphatidylglycerol lysyltransferase domain-containing protein [Gemmatimonadaceae bacterium]